MKKIRFHFQATIPERYENWSLEQICKEMKEDLCEQNEFEFLGAEFITEIAPPNLTSGCTSTLPPKSLTICTDHCQGKGCAMPGILHYKCGELPCDKDFINAIHT
jgi:hypothetical protein